MAVTGIDASNFLEAATGLGFGGNTDEVLLAGWAFDPVGQHANAICQLFSTDGASNQNSRWLSAGGTGNPSALIIDASANINATAAANNPNDAWYSVQGWHNRNLATEVWLNGGSKGSGAGTLGTFPAPNRFRVGLFKSNTAFNAACAYAEQSAWDPDGFDESDRNDLGIQLAAGVNPITLTQTPGQPWTGRLIAYYRLENATDLEDLSGNGFPALAVTGSISTFASHPPVDPVPAVVPDPIDLLAVPASTNRVDLSWANPPNTDATRVRRRATYFASVFVGANGDPWNPVRWQDVSIGDAVADTQGNRGRLATLSGDTQNDMARLVAIMPAVGDQRLELPPVVIPNAGFRLSLFLRSNSQFTAAQHMEEGYQFFVERTAPNTAPRVQLWRMNGAGQGATQLQTAINFGGTGTTNVRIRCEALGSTLRMEVVAGTGPFTGSWTFSVTDSMWPSGVHAITNGGGGFAPSAIVVRDIVIREPAFVQSATPGAVDGYPDASGLLPGVLYEYEVYASDGGVDIGFGEAAALTPAAPSGGGVRSRVIGGGVVIP